MVTDFNRKIRKVELLNIRVEGDFKMQELQNGENCNNCEEVIEDERVETRCPNTGLDHLFCSEECFKSYYSSSQKHIVDTSRKGKRYKPKFEWVEVKIRQV
jgi:hypothetical protein